MNSDADRTIEEFSFLVAFCALLAISVTGVCSGLSSVHILKADEFPPYHTGLITIVYWFHPPPRWLTLFWGSPYGLVFHCALVIGFPCFAWWLGLTLRSRSLTLLSMLTLAAYLTAVPLWLWLHAYMPMMMRETFGLGITYHIAIPALVFVLSFTVLRRCSICTCIEAAKQVKPTADGLLREKCDDQRSGG